MKRNLVELSCMVCALVACRAPLAAEEAPRSYGVSAGAFVSQFIGGQSGPTTPLSDTRYSDTFSTGFGMRLEAFRDFSERWRGQLGLVYAQWSGKSFTGGEFPAGAQFDDFSLAGPYIGGTYRILRGQSYDLYALGNLGLVHLSSVSVTSGGSTMPYWSSHWKDYLELGAGVAHRMGAGSLTLDLRLQAFGKPKPEASFPIAEATGGQSLLLGIGYEWGRK